MFTKLLIALFATTFICSNVQAQRPRPEDPNDELYGTFVGCASGNYIAPDFELMPDTYPEIYECTMACYYDAKVEALWSYYSWPTGECRCSNTYFPLNLYSAMPNDPSYVEVGRCGDNDYTVQVSATTFSTQACYNTQENPNSEAVITPMGKVADPEECLRRCYTYEQASIYLQGDADGATLDCSCGPYAAFEHQFEFAVPCDYNTYTLFLHQAGTVVNSVYAKRQLRERLIRLKGKKRALCPGNLTACNVAGVADSFECIDTTQELESCGGCTAGEYNEKDAPFGVDCTSLPGVPRGGITCSNSKCNAFACKSGWTLASNGTCIDA